MPRRHGPPIPRYKSGPECGEKLDEQGNEIRPACPYRDTCFGYAPATGPDNFVSHIQKDGQLVPIEPETPINTEYLFILEALGADEVAAGRNAVGPTGTILNKLLHRNSPLRRSDVTVANTVRCRPVEWEECEECKGDGCKTCKGDGQTPVLLDYNKDHTNSKPSPGQIRECTSRYMDNLLSRFQGKYIVALGKIPASYMAGRNIKITDYRGSIFEPGQLAECVECAGTGTLPGKPKNCKDCNGKGVRKCTECNRYKHLKRCSLQTLEVCDVCTKFPSVPDGKIPGRRKQCRECDGSGRVPLDPDNPYVSDKLKQHQLLFMSYHPAFLTRNPAAWTIVERDFSRLGNLEAELVEVTGTTYDQYPPPSATDWIGEAHSLSVDLETTGSLDPTRGDITVVGATDRVGFGASFDPSDGRVRDIISRPQIVGQNFVLYDWWWLHNKGFDIPDETQVVDTRYLGKLLNPDTPNDLVYLTGEFANPPIRGYWKTKQNYRDNIEDVVCIDVDAAQRVLNGQFEQVENRQQNSLVWDYIVPLSRVVFEMRCNGMRIDKEKMDETRAVILKELGERRLLLPFTKADGSTGSEGQHAKVQSHLYEELGLPVQKKRGTGKRTANGEALEELRSRLEQDHTSVRHLDDSTRWNALEFIKNLSACRDLSKLEGNFLRYKLSPEQFVHPALNMGGSPKGKHESGRGTATWRFSCSDPNAQQVPKSARGIFVPDFPDWEIMSVDLHQAEVVGFLWYAEAWDVLEKVLKHGMDAHTSLAEKIIGRELPNADIPGTKDKEVRDEFKTTTFAMLYGEAERTTAQRLHRPLSEIKETRQYYFKMLPGVEEYRRSMIKQCMHKGYVESPFGFRRYLYLEKEYGRAANQACNMPIQNIPPIVIGRAMIGMHRELPKPARLWMQVHDELVLTYPKAMRDEVLECTLEWMGKPVPELSAPTLKMAGGLRFNLDVEVGPNWGSLEKLER